MMKNTSRLFTILLGICLCSLSYAQQGEIVCRGVIKDPLTNIALKDVRIYYRDTVPALCSDVKGQFNIKAKVGDRLHFRKAGYGWHTQEITGADMQVGLRKSDGTIFRKNMGNAYNAESTDIFYDGVAVPFDEWMDAWSIHNKNEIVDLQIWHGEFQDEDAKHIVKKNKVAFTSIFQWNAPKNP